MNWDLNASTVRTIQTGTVIGIAVLALGLLLSGTDYGEGVLLAGAVVLVFTPLAGILTSLACLLKAGDRKWAAVAVVLIAVVVLGLAITLLK